ncbi:formylglycine-generating enzyme family protein [uncultured Thiohalocapsa sp.]|uniref:formylglycine-generating enzyme family protein n=1 Tax=uncultured Thiohalocapsa sp. TaxID=768990 RepID=UPI0025F70480|nr:formylglycine-generating enzyme family protein [uncultured Thiohalocapsa sp.]
MAKHALLVGVDDYAPGLPLAPCTPVQALEPLREALKARTLGGFRQVQILRNPGRTELTEILARRFAATHRGDLLLLYIAAAGRLDGAGRAHLLLPGHAGALAPEHSLSLATVMNSLRLSPCIRRVVLLNVGFTAPADAPTRNVLARKAMKIPDTAVLASAAGVPFRTQGPSRVGRRLLTPWLTDLLLSPDADAPRLVTVNALYERLRRETPAEEAVDRPRIWLGHLSRGALVIARKPAMPMRAASVPPQQAAQPPSAAGTSAPRAEGGARSTRRRGYAGRRGSRPNRRRPRRRRGRLRGLLRLPVRLAGLALLGPIALFLAGEDAHRDLQVAVAKVAHQTAPETFKRLFVREAGAIFSDPLAGGGRGPALAALPGGFFMMGSYAGEPERQASEGPVHEVGIDPFAIGITEVSFAEYDRFARATGRPLPPDAGWGRGNRPVINVSWEDATAYARWLSMQTGEDYFLPTEAQWEYAARANTTTPFATGGCVHTDQANYNGVFDYAGCGARTGIYRGQTLPATALPPNPWGLYHMQGNVWEWVRDCWQPRHPILAGIPKRGTDVAPSAQRVCEQRVIRGGGWRFEPGYLRSAVRLWARPGSRDSDTGFRVARALD